VEANPTLPTGGSGSKDPIPDYVKIFGQVFSEERFAKLPNRKPWYHTIELIPGAQPKGCKVYPISVTEQSELDRFLTENLETEHHQITHHVLGRLAEHQLYLQPEKCEFEKTRIEYLGLIISENRVEMDPVKVAGVAEWPEPCNKQEVQSFLRFANFYRRFIKDFSHHARLLFNLTKNEQKWQWGPPEASAFRKLKELVTSAPVLTTPADDQPFHIEADSSDFATGAVLSQLSTEDAKWHPVAYYSKSLSETERNYEIHDKEMLAIIRALDEWRHFLRECHGQPWGFPGLPAPVPVETRTRSHGYGF